MSSDAVNPHPSPDSVAPKSEQSSRMRTIHALVSGHVQGVGFRWNCLQEAERLGLSGSVRNLSDGDVEVYAHGESGQVAQLIAWLFHGPRWAHVAGVTVKDIVAAKVPQETFTLG